ncbi:MAG: ATP-binding cassette domain-containing protein [candidate division KSB1 bacterium]|jgi:ATPase subunit of ABC transporter with duplicated ATPase domains|nr:ATP-binding cassette domain-containing protein [candidate division KSB1 bacterium]
MAQFIYINELSYSYPSSPEPLFDTVSIQLQQGWTGVVGANGSGKTTLLKLICGEFEPDNGHITKSGPAYYCPQRTDHEPDQFHKIFNTSDSVVFSVKKTLKLEDSWEMRWNSLSHGERKRCQIATALVLNPAILAVDEPSNHLDRNSKEILFNALRAYKGIGLLVSHDRQLLDELCTHTLFIFPPHIDLRRCNYSAASIEIERENQEQIQAFQSAKKEIRKLRRKVSQQRENARGADKKRSKRNISNRDHDAKEKKDIARMTGKDALEGRLHARLKTQLERSERRKEEIEFRKTQALGIFFDADAGRRGFPITIPSHTIALGPGVVLRSPDLMIQYSDRIGMVGGNGSGKSSFLRHFISEVQIEHDRIIYIPQEISADESRRILEKINHLKRDKMALIMAIISRLGSDPEHVLETKLPSPGEVRKLMLAEGLLRNPGLIVMDEPTNHMDLPSLKCIEEALNQCTCALLLVSHDYTFLKNTVSHFWKFLSGSDGKFRIREDTSLDTSHIS